MLVIRSKSTYLGTVEAPDESTPELAAAEQFQLNDQQRCLIIMAVDRKFWEHHLAEAERQIAQSERLVDRQRKLVAELERDGRDTARGRCLLTLFEELLAMDVSERDRLRGQLDLRDFRSEQLED